MIFGVRPFASIVLAAAIVLITAIPAAHGKDIIQMLFHMSRPPGESEPSVEYLAEQIDWLEKHVDSYGTVVAKIPDVWGQARLTKHRQEYENEMYQQLNKFDIYLQGAVSQSDQAFLANALTLQAAASSPAPKPGAKTKFFNAKAGTNLSLQMASSTPVASSAPSAASSSKPAAPDASSLLASPDKFFTTMQPINLSNFGQGANKIGIEPTIALDQRATYLDHLHEIRRRNEGDDTADSPGYGLYLVRIPISVMPGKRTFHGYAAEITLTARPHLSPSLLAETFRNLVVNDVVDQLSLPITRLADYILSKPPGAETEQVRQLTMQIEFRRGELAALTRAGQDTQMLAVKAKSKDLQAPNSPSMHSMLQAHNLSMDELMKIQEASPKKIDNAWKFVEGAFPNDERIINAQKQLAQQKRQRDSAEAQIAFLQTQIASLSGQVTALLQQSPERVTALHGPASRMREARNAIPPTQIADVYGSAELYYIAETFNDSYKGPNVIWNDDPNNKHVMYLDVQGFLQDEVQAAYELLSRPENVVLWQDPGFSLEQIAWAIRVGRFHQVCQMRENFYNRIQHPSAHMLINRKQPRDASGDDCDEQVVKALAWAILVESALLNGHLIGDMNKVAATKGAPCSPPDGTAFYMPEPDDTAKMLFNEYVNARWPIHVFALDPYIQEQNIANDFQRRREMQIALALGFAQGQISANNMMNYTRRVETEIQTVQLNKTIVAFSHGDDTFGWRFYPRLQPPPIKGNLQTFVDTLFGPSSKCDLLEQKLEPGMRECAALVIMPSFVPYMTLDTRSNWFRLNAHSGWLPTRHKRENSMVDTMKMSRAIRTMHEMSAQVCDSRVYRVCDVRLMTNRIHQLDRLLPMQGMTVQVPIENSLGGFQMFNNGVTDLSPELHGWYGAPGVMLWKNKPDPACQGCSSCAAASQSTKQGGGQASGPSPTGQDGQSTRQQSALVANSQGSGNTTKATQSTPTSLADDATKLAGTTVKLATDVVNLTSSSLTTITNAATKQPKGPGDVSMPPDCDCSGTTVFLVGNHFSVVDTKVIVGGVCIPREAVTLLSRQVMQVTIPWNANVVTIDQRPWVAVHVATPYGVTGHLHIPVYYGDAAPTSNSPTLAEVATTVSPLEAKLDPPSQQLVVKFKHAGDFTLDGLANVPPATITIKCVDQAVCDARKGYDTLIAVVNYDSKRSDPVTLDNSEQDEPKNWPLEVDPEKLWQAISDHVFKPHADVFGALAAQYAADPNNVSLKIDLYLQGPNRPDLHVIGQLLLKFVDENAKVAPRSGAVWPSLPRQNQARAAISDQLERRYPPQAPVESGIRLVPAQPSGARALGPAKSNPYLQRLPPLDPRGYLPYAQETPRTVTGDLQTPRHPSADARALPPSVRNNVPTRR